MVTAICQGSFWKSGWFSAARSAKPVGIHDFKLTKNSAPVSQWHSPFFRYFMSCKIQSLQQRRIARKYASLFVQTAVSAVTAPFIPERPSAHITRTSFTPRFFSSFRTPSQYFALSFSPICMDNTCLCPVRLTARTTYAASFLSVRFLVQKDVQHQ